MTYHKECIICGAEMEHGVNYLTCSEECHDNWDQRIKPVRGLEKPDPFEERIDP